MQMIAAEDIGRQILTYGERYTEKDFKFHFNLNSSFFLAHEWVFLY